MGNKKTGASMRLAVAGLLLLAVFFGWLGYQPNMLINEYARALAFTLLGVGLAVFFVDTLFRQREERLVRYLDELRQSQDEAQAAREVQLLKAQLIREIGSGDSGLALRAIRELDERGWLTDGTLSSSHLSGADLHGASLSWVNLSGAFLGRINFQDADLSYANFNNATLHEARLARATLDLANLSEAELRGADLSLCSMNETDLTGADLQGATLSGATMVEANLTKARAERAALNGANLERAIMAECDLGYANLERANLSGAGLNRAVLRRANLERANLAEANLSGANLEGARLNGADLAGAFLLGAQVALNALATARSLENATMPDGSKYEEWIQRQAGEGASSPEEPDAADPPFEVAGEPAEIPAESEAP